MYIERFIKCVVFIIVMKTETIFDDKYYCNLGKKCLDSAFYGSAAACYKMALRINPYSSEAKTGLERILEIESKKLESNT